MKRKPAKTKLDFVRGAQLCLAAAERNLINASADLGTPEEIDDAKTLVKHARMALQDLLGHHGDT